MMRMSMVVAALAAISCGGGSTKTGGASTPKPSPGRPIAKSCDAPTPTFPIAPVLADATHPCRAWVVATSGRVFAQTIDSAVVWSRRTPNKTGVVVSAMHSLGAGWFGPVNTVIEERFMDPTKIEPVARLFAPSSDGTFVEATSAIANLFAPEVPKAENTDKLVDIHPRHDFFAAAMDGKRYTAPRGLAPAPGPITTAELVIDDPSGHTTTAPTFAAVKPGDLVLLVGVPRDPAIANGGAAASVGRVLADAEVPGVQDKLRTAQDPEGHLPYDAEAEMFVEGEASVGMSGGGAFDRDGRLVGILVRGTDAKGPNGLPYVRVVRLPYIVATMKSALDKVPADKRDVYTKWLGSLD